MCLNTTNEQDDCDECEKIFEEKLLVEKPLFINVFGSFSNARVSGRLGPFFLLQPTAFITLFLSTRNAKKDLKANVASLVNNTDITELISCRCASSRGVYFSWFSLTGSLLSDLLFGRFLAFLSVRKCTTVSVLKTSSTSQPFVLFFCNLDFFFLSFILD